MLMTFDVNDEGHGHMMVQATMVTMTMSTMIKMRMTMTLMLTLGEGDVETPYLQVALGGGGMFTPLLFNLMTHLVYMRVCFHENRVQYKCSLELTARKAQPVD